MSVRTILEDAEHLYIKGRKEGALLSILVALAATSRKRYPRTVKKDRDAFTAFLGEELTKRIRVGKFMINFRNKMIPLQDLFYEFVRCELAHEAKMPEDIKFTKKSDMLQVKVDEKEITFSENIIDILFDIVLKAEENKEEFKDVLERIKQGKNKKTNPKC